MNKQLRMRPVFNIFIIILGVDGIIAAVFLSWMGYQNNKIPEAYTDQQIVNQVMQDYSKDGFKEDDIQNISVKKSDDNRSFSATVDLVKETEICKREYSVNYSYGMVDGCWVEDEGAEEFICQEPEWLLQGTSWSAETEEGIEYYISFLSSTDAIINVTEKNIDGEENADGLEENVDELYEEDDEAHLPHHVRLLRRGLSRAHPCRQQHAYRRALYNHLHRLWRAHPSLRRHIRQTLRPEVRQHPLRLGYAQHRRASGRCPAGHRRPAPLHRLVRRRVHRCDRDNRNRLPVLHGSAEEDPGGAQKRRLIRQQVYTI